MGEKQCTWISSTVASLYSTIPGCTALDLYLGMHPLPESHEITASVYCPHLDYRDKSEKRDTVNENILEHTVTKGNLKKKKKVTHKSTQTDKEEYKPKIDIADLTSDGI
jgi:hypothetical protein